MPEAVSPTFGQTWLTLPIFSPSELKTSMSLSIRIVSGTMRCPPFESRQDAPPVKPANAVPERLGTIKDGRHTQARESTARRRCDMTRESVTRAPRSGLVGSPIHCQRDTDPAQVVVHSVLTFCRKYAVGLVRW